MSRLCLFASATLLALATFACDGDDDDDQDALDGGEDVVEEVDADVADVEDVGEAEDTAPDATEVTGYTCVRLPERMAERTSCRQDDHCPCGMHCLRGLCAYDCLEDADCAAAGQWCDPFGRCRPAEQTQPIPPVDRAPEGSLAVSPVAIRITDRTTPQTVTLEAVGLPVTDVRVEAGTDLEVRCDVRWERECLLPSIDPEAPVTLWVRPVAVPREPDRNGWLLRIFHGSRMEVVGLEEEALDADASGPPPAGTYAGTARLATASLQLAGTAPRTSEEHRAALRGFWMDVTLEVFPDGSVVLRDPMRVLLPDGFVRLQLRSDGSLVGAGGAGEGATRVLVLGTDPRAGRGTVEAEVTAVFGGSLHLYRENRLAGSLVAALDGLGGLVSTGARLDERPRLEWEVTARRTGDAPAAGPPSFTPYVPAYARAERLGHRLPWEAEVAACLPSDWWQPAAWAQRVQNPLCHAHPTGSGPASAPAVAYDPDPAALTPSGDFLCHGAGAAPTLGYFANALRTPPLHASTLLGVCLTDAERAAEPPVAGSDSYGPCLARVSGVAPGSPPSCLDAPLVLRALGVGFDSMERRGTDEYPYWTTRAEDGNRMALRVLQQWLEIHAFLASEAGQQNDLPLAASPPSLERALRDSLAGWNALLHPRVAARLLHLPATVLADPDYRDGVEEPPSAGRTAPVGIPTAILDTLSAQLEAATVLLEQASYRSAATTPEPVPAVFRHALLLAPLAELLHERAAAAGPLAWDVLWQRAAARFARARDGALRMWRSFLAGENPLGIADEDLPLYRDLSSPTAAAERFSAVSTYLIDGWARDAVAAAQDAHDDAVAAWRALLERNLQIDMATSEARERKTQRLDEIRRTYGERILELCGNPLRLGDAREVLDRWTDIDPATCFVDRGNPACNWDESLLLADLRPADVRLRLCTLGEIRQIAPGAVSFHDARYDELVRQAFLCPDCGYLNVLPGGRQFTLGGATYDSSRFFSDRTFDLGDLGDELRQATAACWRKYPDGRPDVLSLARLPDSPIEKATCYGGTLGEMALAVRASLSQVEQAKSAAGDFKDRYDIAMRSCFIQKLAYDEMRAAEERHAAVMAPLENWHLGLTIGAMELRAIADFRFDQGWWSAALNMTATQAEIAALLIQREMENAQAEHEAQMTEIQRHTTERICFNDAEMHLVGCDTQSRAINTAILDATRTAVQFRNAQDEVRRLVTEGRARLADTEALTYTLPTERWSDLWNALYETHRGDVERYRRRMRLARRTTYLAVRAVEYEWQMSHRARADVLAATTPDDLEAVLDDLRTSIASGTIGAQRPENIHVVVSLRDHLLQLADHSDWSDGTHTLDPVSRFRLLLGSRQFARYDDRGNYLGQVIPFSIAPLGELGLGEPGTIPLLTGADCSERVWTVNATLHGDGISGSASTTTRLELLQENTFFSQWCLPPDAGDPPMQEVSTRPMRNLFRDPIYGGDYGSSVANTTPYVRARIQAYHNVPWATFESEGYHDGASEELATRALYGDWALFLPAEMLGPTGLQLDRLDDILLRFDYVSAAKTW